MSDQLLNLAFAMHSNPGVYALLLGSGVSRSAGMPTGWEIVEDLIRKIAAASGDEPPTDPEAWYKDAFDEPPEYSKLLERLGKTQTERRGLLRTYFEPSDDEREEGLKVPTDAHRAIARLTKDGYVRMILTTNFDRLIETALADAGVAADVLSSVDDLEGAVPFVHSKAVVIKLHGDYLDTRIKNTPEELSAYPKELKMFVDRVFDEFGLVVCGWSAEWDNAMASAIRRCKSRRFTTYWLARGELTDQANRLIARRQAEVIRIDGADVAFNALVEKVESIAELNTVSPSSVAALVATAKRYLADEGQRIRLEDLVRAEIETVSQESGPERLPMQVQGLTEEGIHERLHSYEAISARILPLLAAIGNYGYDWSSDLLTHAIERLIPPWQHGGLVHLLSLQSYPALLAIYSAGVSAFAAERYSNLNAVLRVPQGRTALNGEMKPIFNVANPGTTLGKIVPRPAADREHTPGSNHLYDLLRPSLSEYLGDETQYEDAFNLFEYLLALTYVDLKWVDADEIRWAPFGRFAWRWRDDWQQHSGYQFLHSRYDQGSDWRLLRAGLFGGSLERLKAVEKMYSDWLTQNVTYRW